MNIDLLYRNAAVHLKMSREKFDSKEFSSALAALVEAYEFTRELIQQVYKVSVNPLEDEPSGTEISP